MIAMREVIFSEQILFVQAEIASDSAHKSAIEDAAWKLIPVFIFQGVQKTQTDARGNHDFVGRDFA